MLLHSRSLLKPMRVVQYHWCFGAYMRIPAPNLSVNQTTEKLRFSVASGLRAPTASYLKR